MSVTRSFPSSSSINPSIVQPAGVVTESLSSAGWAFDSSTIRDAPSIVCAASSVETSRGMPSFTPASASDGDRDPAFGEYVYVEELPEALYKVAPSYPEDARRASIDGTVLVQALIGKDGHVKDTRVTKSIPMLDGAAVRAVLQWTFVPAKSKGKPVAVWVAVPVKFSLK